MPYQGEAYVDLVTTTLRNLERVTWADIVVDLQKHIALPYLLRQKRVTFGSGYGHQFNVRFFTNNAARNVKLNEEDNPTTADTQATGNVPWRHTETHWALEERVIAMNRAPARLVNLVQTSRVDAMVSIAEVMETNFWNGPTSTSDELTPYGVPVWIVKGTGPDFSFDGGDPTNVSGGAGSLSSTTYSRWKNGYAEYEEIAKHDLVRKWREAATKSYFVPPVEGPYSNVSYQMMNESNSGYDSSRMPECGYYTVYEVLSTMEEILEAQNDNLGNDVASKDGATQFRKTPVIWVPWLDQNADASLHGTNPVYGINWRTFKPCFLEGEFLRPTQVKPHPLHHRTITQYFDSSYNFFCVDRRANFLLSQAS